MERDDVAPQQKSGASGHYAWSTALSLKKDFNLNFNSSRAARLRRVQPSRSGEFKFK